MWICEIYAERPEMCRSYPRPDSYRPPGCSFFFPGDGSRTGECNQCGECCGEPRVDGEPLGKPLSLDEGGQSCKYLDWKEE
jgi:Fe-S-cluster containining protein